MPDCPFCEVKSDLVVESPLVVAFPDKFPVSGGHTLVVPRRHVPSYFECSPEEKAEIWALVDAVREKLLSLEPDGFNVGMNIGRAAGQTVFHAHVHVIPRRTGDSSDPRGGVRHALEGRGYPRKG